MLLRDPVVGFDEGGIGKEVHLSQTTVSQSAMRGRKIALEEGLRLNMVSQ